MLNGNDEGAQAVDAVEELDQFHVSVRHLFSDVENMAQQLYIENLRGLSLFADHQLKAAIDAHTRGEVLSEKLIELDAATQYREKIAVNLTNLASLQFESGDLARALVSSKQAINLMVAEIEANPANQKIYHLAGLHAVSYTHLTLPTKA